MHAFFKIGCQNYSDHSIKYFGLLASQIFFLQICFMSGYDFLIRYEISSKANYEQKLTYPIVPEAYSGITIGIGYDLGYVSASELAADWKNLEKKDLELLKTVVGLKKDQARAALPKVKHIKVPYSIAQQVFYHKTIPKKEALTQVAFPGYKDLHIQAQRALVSIVANRGHSISGPDRTEMHEIRKLIRKWIDQDNKEAPIKKNIYKLIADQIVSMKRLWPNLKGLRDRRDSEAAMVRSCQK